LLDIALRAFPEFGVGLVAEMDPNASGDMGISIAMRHRFR
jgi:hypothetical protein